MYIIYIMFMLVAVLLSSNVLQMEGLKNSDFNVHFQVFYIFFQASDSF